jgi:signal transduction histidine kinase
MSEPGGNLRQRAPLRFVWRVDAEHRFTVGSDEFAALMGPRTAAALGRPWPELTAALALDPQGQIALALASRETWSGLCIAWPVDDGRERLTIELSGLPVFDRERAFRGYRGFGICRDVGRAAPVTEAPVAASAVAADAVAAGAAAPEPTAPGSENVVPLRPSGPTAAPALSPLERSAFHELSRKLHERLTAGTGASLAASAGSNLAEVAPELAARLPPRGAVEPRAADAHAALAHAQAEISELRAKLAAAAESPDRPAARPPGFNPGFDLLAELAQAIRTPLATIIGASAIMRQEQLGPIDERYRQHVRDILSAGEQLLAQVDDLVDLSRIEAGKLDLDFAAVALNPLTQQCVASLQPQANRDRIIIRTSLSPRLPPVLADARSLHRMALNLVSHSTRLAGAGGQVIVSTALTDLGEVVLRVRDSGTGMSESEMALGLKPFRQVAAAVRRDPTGVGLALPLTKALAQANHAGFSIKNAPHAGTLIEVTFPPDRVAGGEAR